MNGLQVDVDAAELPTLSAAMEVAVYRIVQEALTNVARHAQAHTARVQVNVVDLVLCLSIEDDGIGLRGGASGGVGLGSMRERAAELGGLCVIGASDMGGTSVVATIPVRSGQVMQ